MFFIKQSEATAARRTVYFNGSVSAALADCHVSKNGGAPAGAAGTIIDLEQSGTTGGWHAYTFTSSEVNTVGFVCLAFAQGGSTIAIVVAQVVPWDPYDAVRLGLTAIPNATAGANGGLPLQGSAIPNANAGATGGLQAGIVRAATAQAGAASTITLDGSASATDDIYNGYRIRITSGTGAGQGNRLITDYVGSTKVATVGPDWTTAPDNTSVFEIYPC